MFKNFPVLSHCVYQWLSLILCHSPCHDCWLLAGVSLAIIRFHLKVGSLQHVFSHLEAASELLSSTGALLGSFDILVSLICLRQPAGIKQYGCYISECDVVIWVASLSARPSCYRPFQGWDGVSRYPRSKLGSVISHGS